MFPQTSGVIATVEFNVTNHHAFLQNLLNMTTSGEYTLQLVITFSLSATTSDNPQQVNKRDVKSIDKTFQMQ